METDQNKDIDFSNYCSQSAANVPANAVPPDFEREEKKKKIQLAIIVVCLILAVGFWGYYFYQQSAKNRMIETDIIPAEMIPE